MTKRIAEKPDSQKAYRLLNDQYLLVWLSRRFDEFVKLLYIVDPYRINIRYRKKLKSKENTIKNSLLSAMKNPKFLNWYNREDLKLYKRVSRELYPSYLTTYNSELKKIRNVRLERKMPFRLKKD